MSATHPQPQGDRLSEASDPGAPDRLRRAWVYQPTMMHVNAILVDGVLSMVGSVNVNRRSVEKDEEVAMAVVDEEITEVLETHFREDTAVSSPVTVSDQRIPLHRRLLTLLLRPISSEM